MSNNDKDKVTHQAVAMAMADHSVTTDSDFHEDNLVSSSENEVLIVPQSAEFFDHAVQVSPNLTEEIQYEPMQEEEEKHCWVCFATEEDDVTAVWVHPCR